MPTITLGGTDPGGFNMLSWSTSQIVQLVLNNFNSNPPSQNTELHYDAVDTEVFIYGTFSNYDSAGDPHNGTITSLTYHSHVLGQTDTLTVTGLSLDMATVYNWIFPGGTQQPNYAAVHNAILGGADTITGTAFDDVIMGYGGADTLNGGAGNDEMYGEKHPFAFDAAPAAGDTLNGGSGNDVLYGGDGNDTLNGGDDMDTLYTGAGVDTVDGGAGVDTLYLDRSTSASAFSFNLATLSAGGVFVDGTTFQNVENFIINLGSGADTVTINAEFTGSYVIDAATGADTLTIDMSASSAPVVMQSFIGTDVTIGSGFLRYSGFDIISVTGGSGNDQLAGTTQNDTLNGNGGNDSIFGDSGADTINGGDGADVLAGGFDNDIVNGGAGDDNISHFGAQGVDQLDGGDGIDTVIFDLSGAFTGINFTMAALASNAGITASNGMTLRNFERISSATLTSGADTFTFGPADIVGTVFINGGGGDDLIVADLSSLTTAITYWDNLLTATFPGGAVSGNFGFERITMTGGSANDQLEGGAGNDTLSGGGGQDVLQGLGGSNIMNGGDAGDLIFSHVDGYFGGVPVDTIDGGAGIDYVGIYYSAATQSFTVDLAQMRSAAGQTLVNGTHVRNVESFGIHLGMGNDTFIVSGQLYAPALSHGGPGSLNVEQWLNGGDGNDTLTADFSAASTSLQLEGNRLTMGGATMGFNVENASITGTTFNDTLRGTWGALTLNGGLGDDYLEGAGDGFDVLNGGDGADTLYSYNEFNAPVNSVLDGGAGFDIANVRHTAASAASTILASAMQTAGGATLVDGTVIRNIERFALTLGQGNDTLTITSALTGTSHYFDGGGGTDRIVFNLSDVSENLTMLPYNVVTTSAFSILFIAEQVEFNGGSGNDELFGREGDDTLRGNDGADWLNGGDGADVLEGGAGDDLLYGDLYGGAAYVDTLTGGSGNDTLNAGAGADTMNGGDGNDTFLVDDAGDVTTEALNQGVDTVQASISHTLGANIENLTLMDGAANGVGNALNNVMTGNAAANALSGGDGADTLAGGLGNDVIQGGPGNDTISYVSGDGADNVDGGADNDTLNITGNANENVLSAAFNGSALTQLQGGALANVESINADMGGGIDWLTYAASVAVVVNLATNSASGFASVANIENVIGGSGGDTLTGNNLANRLDGGQGGDAINGGGGGDIIIGGEGDDQLAGGFAGDSLDGGAGNDTAYWVWGDGADTFNGGADSDTFSAQGSAVDNIVSATWNGTSLTKLFDNVLNNVEAVNLDMLGGVDWLSYTASAAVTVDLEAGAASGFASVTAVENVIGGSGNDTITGSSANNRLDGGMGDDTLNGGAGSDVVLGGDGADALAGGLGNDSLQGAGGADTFAWAWGDGRDTFNGGADFDTVNATGSAAENVVRATWDGSAITGLFDNALVSIEAINLDMGGDQDWLQYASSSGVTVNLGTGAATGFASIASVENVVGGAGGDSLTGDGGTNKLLGGDGADTLTGAGGVDILTGGLGNDTFVYASGAGNDNITDFDANATGGQDFLDIAAFGITSGDFASRVVITDLGANTRVVIDGSVVITLANVTGDGDNVISAADFILA